MSRADDSDGTATVYVISGRATPDELAALVAVFCIARARRAGPQAAGLPRLRRPCARWRHLDQNPSFLPAHSWRSASPRLSPAAGPIR